MIYFNQDLPPSNLFKTRAWTRKLIDSALSLNGRYYLTYQPNATLEQFQKAYPEFKRSNLIKTQYDPNRLFNNKLYERYF